MSIWLSMRGQVERLTKELDQAQLREESSSQRAAQAVAMSEAKIAAARRHLVEMSRCVFV
jgi:hypothetical protein